MAAQLATVVLFSWRLWPETFGECYFERGGQMVAFLAMSMLITLDWIPRFLLFWALWLHGCEGRWSCFSEGSLTRSLWMVLFWTWRPDGGVLGDGPAYHIGLDSSGLAVLDVVVTRRWRLGWRRSWRWPCFSVGAFGLESLEGAILEAVA